MHFLKTTLAQPAVVILLLVASAAGAERIPIVVSPGIRIESPLTLKLTGIMSDGFAPGRYRAELMLARRDGPNAGNATTVEMRGSPGAAPVTERIDLLSAGDSVLRPSVPVDITGGTLELTIRPSGGPVTACAVAIALDGKR